MTDKKTETEVLTFDEGGHPQVRADLVPSEATALLRKAVEENKVDLLEKLVVLYREEEDRQAEKAIKLSLAKFQQEMAPIKHNRSADIATRSGSNYGYTYATLDELDKQCTPLMAQYGLARTWDSKMEGGVLTVTCTLHHNLGASLSSSFVCPIDSSAKMSGAQKAGAAQTYGKRQSLIAVLGITTAEDDTDGVEQGNPEPITEKQVRDLEEWVDACGPKFKADKFLAWCKVEKLSDLPRAKFDMALKALQQAHEKASTL